jgi:hypothetical protein
MLEAGFGKGVILDAYHRRGVMLRRLRPTRTCQRKQEKR